MQVSAIDNPIPSGVGTPDGNPRSSSSRDLSMQLFAGLMALAEDKRPEATLLIGLS